MTSGENKIRNINEFYIIIHKIIILHITICLMTCKPRCNSCYCLLLAVTSQCVMAAEPSSSAESSLEQTQSSDSLDSTQDTRDGRDVDLSRFFGTRFMAIVNHIQTAHENFRTTWIELTGGDDAQGRAAFLSIFPFLVLFLLANLTHVLSLVHYMIVMYACRHVFTHTNRALRTWISENIGLVSLIKWFAPLTCLIFILIGIPQAAWPQAKDITRIITFRTPAVVNPGKINVFQMALVTGSADWVIKFGLMHLKLVTVILYGRNDRLAILLHLIEAFSLFYRHWIPVRPWLIYFNYGWWSPATITCYLIIKVAHVWPKIRGLYHALRMLLISIEQDILPQSKLEDGCSICKESFKNPIKLNCGHWFCNWCVLRWIQKQNTCPTCRKMTDGSRLPIFGDGSTYKMLQTM